MEAQSRNKKICRICRQGGGVCRQGLRKTHVRSDPAYRFHGSDARGNTAVAHGDTARSTGHAAPGDGDGEEPARPRHVPFEQMTRFVTKGGIGLHYLPGPLDKWIRREVVNQAGEWYDSKPVDPSLKLKRGNMNNTDRGSLQDAKRGRMLTNSPGLWTVTSPTSPRKHAAI